MRILLLASIFMIGCTDAQFAKFTALGSEGKIICYSGGRIVYQGESSGKISTEEKSDGWFFKDKATGDLIRVSADCVIRN